MNRRHFLQAISKVSFAVLLFSLFPKKLLAKLEREQIKNRFIDEIRKYPDKSVTNRIRKLEVLPNPDKDKKLYPRGKIPSYILEIRYDRADGKDRIAQCLFDPPQTEYATWNMVSDFLTQIRVDHKMSLATLTGKKYNEIIF